MRRAVAAGRKRGYFGSVSSSRVPVVVLSGFLGSGKTTLLNHLLREAGGRRVAVIVNEFGEVGIDGARVAGSEQFVELDNGCLCCALNEDLKRTLADLRERGGFEHLVLETTGLADPLPVAWTFSRPGLADFYRVDAIVTVVDAAHLDRALAEAPEATLQIERADLLVLNKLDLVADDGAAARARIEAMNPRAPVLSATRGRVDWDLLLDAEAPRIESAPEPEHHHRPSFESVSFETDRVVSADALEDLFYELPRSVYRVKGLVRTNGADPWLLVNAVAGRFELEPFSPASPPARSALVFIGRDLDRADLGRRCAALAVG
jgi:G3E family GTPase